MFRGFMLNFKGVNYFSLERWNWIFQMKADEAFIFLKHKKSKVTTIKRIKLLPVAISVVVLWVIYFENERLLVEILDCFVCLKNLNLKMKIWNLKFEFKTLWIIFSNWKEAWFVFLFVFCNVLFDFVYVYVLFDFIMFYLIFITSFEAFFYMLYLIF